MAGIGHLDPLLPLPLVIVGEGPTGLRPPVGQGCGPGVGDGLLGLRGPEPETVVYKGRPRLSQRERGMRGHLRRDALQAQHRLASHRVVQQRLLDVARSPETLIPPIAVEGDAGPGKQRQAHCQDGGSLPCWPLVVAARDLPSFPPRHRHPSRRPDRVCRGGHVRGGMPPAQGMIVPDIPLGHKVTQRHPDHGQRLKRTGSITNLRSWSPAAPVMTGPTPSPNGSAADRSP